METVRQKRQREASAKKAASGKPFRKKIMPGNPADRPAGRKGAGSGSGQRRVLRRLRRSPVQKKGQQEASGETADVCCICDVRGGETEEKREKEHDEKLPEREPLYPSPVPEQDVKNAADDREDHAGGADRDRAVRAAYLQGIVDQISGKTSAESRDQEAHASGLCLQDRAHHVEQQHIVEQVADSGVQEHGGEQSPVLSPGDQGRISAAAVDKNGSFQGASVKLRQHEGRDIQCDEPGSDGRKRSVVFHNGSSLS